MPSIKRDSMIETFDYIGNILESAIRAKDRAKEKPNRILSPPNTQPSSEDEDDIFSDAAFDPARVLHGPSPKPKKSTREAIKDDLQSAKHLIAHPRRLMRGKAARVTAEKVGGRHPLLTVDRDQELLEAHDTLAQATSNNGSDLDDDLVDNVDQAKERVAKIEQQRESLQSAWILGRHVMRVKVVRPISHPDQSQFKMRDRFEWERYLGYMALYHTRSFTAMYIDDFSSPPFDLEDLARIIERIAITSAPWQSFVVNVREVYTWKDPQRTAKWLALYCVLWYTQYIVAYFYFWIIYRTLRNRLGGRSVQTVRESVDRAFYREGRVQAWGELIQRHGKNDWLEPFLDELGPLIQLQLGDFADLLEILVNFHRWERPRLTLATLFFCCCCLAISLCADMAFCVKLVWFIAGGAFFLTYPLATNFPKYRLLLSHWRWVFWDIPTHAQLAVLRLQEKAAVNAVLKEFHYGVDDRSKTEQLQSGVENGYAFKIYDTSAGKGRLTVDRTSLTTFVKSGLGRTWLMSALTEMRKLDDLDVEPTSTLKNLKHLQTRSTEALQFLFLDGTDLIVLLQPGDRDRIFNLVLAWSKLKWQCLQMDRHVTMESERNNLDRAIKRAFT